VCAAADLAAVKVQLPPDFWYVTPGIQGPTTAAGSDQKRVFTPYQAIKAGARLLVVGRAITAAADRLQAGREILAEIVKAL
jgi:orotidine-5'-phosphate decarboxylase